ncbi:hypothetical protein ARHIZOSPH14_16260 [Agromyces rhizosphaerae]|uniref:SbsA Ig-like domain-containing protein n=1 Tax=Agromyces rhizosphaerae TaxID=88374 RepID=A0A9W6CY13_9MICO|nr:hypothetical protein [Agromyces rhizosphaerae]GLI27384.1 hypothetical protein ARHIZOSPH14_16260 [Agromyces rhizosphaerae]
MSTDPGAFRRALTGTLVVLGAAGLALVVTSALQGPKVAATSVDPIAVTELAGQQVVIELNQPIVRIDGDLAVDPQLDATVSFEDDLLFVEFAEPLPYATEVELSINGVVGESQPNAGTIAHRFTTADADVVTLVRNSPAGEPDRLVRSSVADPANPEVLLEAPVLEQFARAGEVIAATAVQDDGTNSLWIAGGGAGDTPAQVALPAAGVVRTLGASTTHPIVAFTLDSGTRTAEDADDDYRSALFALDVSGGAVEPVPVTGPTGEVLQVTEWWFVPGTASLVVQDFEGALLLVDPLTGADPVALGAHDELRGVLPGSRTLVVADPDGGTLIDLETGDRAPNDLPVADLPDGAYPGRVVQLDAAGAYLMQVLLPTIAEDGSTRATALVIRVDDAGTSVLYSTDESSRMLEFCASPNGRLLAVETAQADAESDRYPNLPSSIDRLTTVVDVVTAELVLTQQGGSSNWCR